MRATASGLISLFVAALAGGACAAPRCVYPVQAFNDPARAAAGDLSPRVRFSEVDLGRRAVGYGSADLRRDEVTIADGRLYLVRPDGRGGAVARHKAAPNEGALMLQAAPVKAWRPSVRLNAVTSFDALGAALDAEARRHGCGGDARFAFRLEGWARRAVWSLDTLPQKAELVTENQRVVIVGLYATIDGERHAIAAGRHLHAHIVFPDLDLAGHLRAPELEDGAKLQLQAR